MNDKDDNQIDYEALHRAVSMAIKENCLDPAGAAILAVHKFFQGIDCYWTECQECGIGNDLERAIAGKISVVSEEAAKRWTLGQKTDQ